eukprot:gnl/MRDRNA2_/MRDRNA2_34054_c0_seq1.p1 gnl/MRDRNA2_/MRDRNA2_34054_c0~~gnl/MRDRNA2_/MRDRNA2_34054_c0_seq1.p1  ORF type:complete len:262 (-),score=43.87 gnl/MRDRNA2_/MRDRNA2_34054_c0_seq1:261-974(-)
MSVMSTPSMQMSLSTPPSTPRKRTSKMNPTTPSTCDCTPLFTPSTAPRRSRTSSSMDELSLSPGFPSPGQILPGSQWEAKVPQVLDKVSVSLMSLLPNAQSDGQEQVPNLWGSLPQPLALPGRLRAPSPSTPKRSPAQVARDLSRSPPPAPHHKTVKLGKALESNDLLEVVEILAKHPRLATMPFWDTHELPLERATRLHCDEMILDILRDNGAGNVDAENRPMNAIQNPYDFPEMW